MNETLKVIKNRRSTRKFKQTQILKEEIEAIIEAGIYAPNGINHQSWHFTVIQQKDSMTMLVEIVKQNIVNSGIEALVKGALNPEFNPFYGAPTLVILSGEENSKFVQIDCGAAAENMAIAAESINVGSCMIASSVFIASEDRGAKLKQELGIPENYNPVISLALGYKDGNVEEGHRRRENIVNYI